MLVEVFLSCLAAAPAICPALRPQVGSVQVFGLLNHADIDSCCDDILHLADSDEAVSDSDGLPATVLPLIAMPPKPSTVPSAGVERRKLGRDAAFFLALMHGFRWLTETGTRSGGIGLGHSYIQSVTNLHGWADGDPFYVNYIGHPMQGAVAGRIFLANDARYNRSEFGRSREYWKGKLRATAFAWAFSEQFEIGPLSEASIGHIQTPFPQQGFVDHVITPTIGLGWMLGEDALDRYVIRSLEDRTTNKWLRMALRTGLNPTRSFANVIDGRAPWDRDSRDGVLQYRPAADSHADSELYVLPAREIGPSLAAPFEFGGAAGLRQFTGGPCMGGGAEAAHRLSRELQLALSVNGCKLLDLPTNLSGDALIYQIGPQWTPMPLGKWCPYVRLLVCGLKITHERLYPDKKQEVLNENRNLPTKLGYTLHDQYISHDEDNGVAFQVGTGVDYKLNDALALRVASIDYLRSTVGTLSGMSYSNGLEITTGIVLRLGTW